MSAAILAGTDTPPEHRGDGLSTSRMPLSVKVSVGVVVVVILVAVLAGHLSKYNPTQVDLVRAYASPSSSHWLGQDEAGRDVLSRLMHAARLSLLGPLLVVVFSMMTGVPLGLMTGYLGGRVDAVVSRAFDILFAIPALLLAIAIVSTYGVGFTTCVIAVTITYIPLMARSVRSATLVEREREYVSACKLQGFSGARVAVKHILPTLVPLILSQVGVFFAYSLLDLAALSFLGLGVQPPSTDWGNMLAGAGLAIFHAPFNVIPPAVTVVALVVSVNLIADFIARRWSEDSE